MPILSVLLLCAVLYLGGPAARAQDESADSASATVTVPAAEWETLKARLDALEIEVQDLKAAQAQPGAVPVPSPTPSGTEAEVAPPEETPAAQPPAAGGKFLALPDISLIVQAKGLASSDTRDEQRNRIRLSEAEIGIQGYVYPNVKADAFLTTSPEENAPMGVEEAYLTYLGLHKGLNLYVGEKHVAFGRTNLLHNHSWLYVSPPLVLRNLAAEESLSGEGVEASYLLPTKGDLFAQLDLGTWTGQGPGEATRFPDTLVGPGAGFSDRFNTARLWASRPLGESNELELGTSYARGPAEGFANPGSGHADLRGLDLTYRHFGEGTSRLLLRGEGIWRHEGDGFTGSTAHGYYLFGNYRKTKDSSLGLLWDWSEFSQAPDFHESALSLILTKQFSEQYYLRLQGTHGSRPGDNSYDELLLQWVWGVGPHTHNLE
jgi:hypothetical protein